ncbi:MAG: Bug family tripartite tricarboxylate transporter substrate binding protein [Hyphomicrobiaceae bacterium]
MNRTLSVALPAAAALFMAGPVTAQGGADFYKGKKIEIVVAAPPGGGFDAYARIIARHISEHIPGNPTIIVKNMGGAGGKTSTAYLWNVAARDGTVINATQPGALVEQILGKTSKVLYDPLKFQYIGSAEAFTSLCLVRSDSAITSFKDLMTRQAVFGGDQIGATTYDHTLMYKNLTGAKIKLVSGYKGTSNLRLALERKEIDGFCGYAWSSLFARSAELVEKGLVRLIVQLGLTDHPEATKAGVPNSWGFVKDDESRKAMELIATVQEFGRPYLVHADVPADRVAILRRAFDATMKDKEYVAEITKAKLDNSPRTGQQVGELLRKVLLAPKAVQEKARWAISTE